MRLQKKYLLSLSLTALTTMTLSGTVFAGQWQMGKGKDADRWWYNNQDGSYPRAEWKWIDGDSDGVSECYYFDADGWMVKSATIEGSRVDASGAWVDESGVVQLRTDSGKAVQNGSSDNEVSTGVIELGSDLDLGTEWEAEAPFESEESAPVSAKKENNAKPETKGDVLEISLDAVSPAKKEAVKSSTVLESKEKADSYGGPGESGVSVFSVNAGPNAERTGKDTESSTAVKDKTSTKKSAEPFSGNVGSNSDAMPRSASTDLVEFARGYIGRLKYAAAGTSLETGADCSGFTQQVFKSFGIKIPRDSRSQYAASEKISVENLKAGDLIFYGSSPSTIYHVGIYTGDGTIVHSTHRGDYVREHDAFYAKPYGYGRFSK